MDLEQRVKQELGWSAVRIARTRPSDLRAALEDQAPIEKPTATVHVPSTTVDVTTLSVPSIALPAEVIITIVRPSKINLDQQLITPHPTHGVITTHAPVTTSPVLTVIPELIPSTTISPPSPADSVKPANTGVVPKHTLASVLKTGHAGEIRDHANKTLRVISTLEKKRRKLEVMQREIKATGDLHDSLILTTVLDRLNLRIAAAHATLLDLKQTIQSSIDRKTQLMAFIVDLNDDDNDDSEVVDKLRRKIATLTHFQSFLK
jgi:hypothetical protein